LGLFFFNNFISPSIPTSQPVWSCGHPSLPATGNEAHCLHFVLDLVLSALTFSTRTGLILFFFWVCFIFRMPLPPFSTHPTSSSPFIYPPWVPRSIHTTLSLGPLLPEGPCVVCVYVCCWWVLSWSRMRAEKEREGVCLLCGLFDTARRTGSAEDGRLEKNQTHLLLL
jgi:hypothetical protein